MGAYGRREGATLPVIAPDDPRRPRTRAGVVARDVVKTCGTGETSVTALNRGADSDASAREQAG